MILVYVYKSTPILRIDKKQKKKGKDKVSIYKYLIHKFSINLKIEINI